MNRHFASALVIGILAQVIALGCYSWLAAAAPGGPLKYVGFVILAVGSIWAVRLLLALSKKAALLGLLIMALAAPLVPLIGSSKASELLSDTSHYLPLYAKAFGVALVCYAVLWLILVSLTTSKQKRATSS